MNWTDPAVQSAVIQSAGNIAAAIITAIVVSIIGQQFLSRKKLQQRVLLQQQDIEFLLAVEEAHCDLHMKTSGATFKLRMRQVAKERNFKWSGKFTPGRVKDSPTFQKAKEACS